MGKATPSGGRGSVLSRSTRPKFGYASMTFRCSSLLQYLCSHLTTDSRLVVRVLYSRPSIGTSVLTGKSQ